MDKKTYGAEIERDIAAAVENFEAMLREQVERNQRMRAERETDEVSVNEAMVNKTGASPENAKSRKGRVIIGTAGGDGIGPIIMTEARKVLEAVLRDRLTCGEATLKPIDGFTLESRLAAGKTVPDSVMAAMRECDVLLKGPTTTPNAAMNTANIESANVYLRKAFDLFANVRPVSIPEEGIDWTFFRENTEGEYALGSRGEYISGELAVDFKVITDEGAERIARAAYEYARANGKKRVSIVTKANIMKKTDGNFLNICCEVAKDYPEIETDSWFIDIMAANLVNKNIRNSFQVFVLPNLYGDIITDEAAQIQGGVGTAGSANIGRNYAIFEAIHGSAPRMIEEGLGEYANPSSLLKAAVMMLSHVGYVEEAKRLEAALEIADEELGAHMTGMAGGATCREYTELVMSRL